MKKFVSMILVLCIVCTTVAFAEPTVSNNTDGTDYNKILGSIIDILLYVPSMNIAMALATEVVGNNVENVEPAKVLEFINNVSNDFKQLCITVALLNDPSSLKTKATLALFKMRVKKQMLKLALSAAK